MPAFGLAKSYGLFDFAGLIAVIGMWEIYPDVAQLLMDIEGNNHTSYQLTLPLPAWLLWLKTACAISIKGLLITIFMLPLGKIILWNRFNLATVNPLKLCIIIIMASLFYGIITLWALSSIKHMSLLGKLWNRYLFPMWMLGCFQFSWQVVHKLFPTMSYLVLINPISFITEATRAAIIGQSNFISFWTCIGVLCGWIFMLWGYTFKQLRKRLDFV